MKTQTLDSHSNVVTSVSYTVNADGTVATKVDGNNHTYSYGYDSNGYGNLISATTPLGNQTQWTADSLGNCTSRTDALNRTTDYSLDAWERLVTATYPDLSTHTFQWDPNSNLTQWVDSAATCSRSYDADDRPTQEVVNNVTTVSWSWDGTGQKGLLSSLTDSGSRTLTLGYTARNELTTVQDGSGTATSLFDADGDEYQLTLQNGAVVSRTFDKDDRLTDVMNKNSTGATLSSFLYTLDNDSRRTGVTELDGSTVSWGYDGASRLTSEARTGTNPYSISYTLDGNSNRTQEVVGTATTSLSYDNDDELNSTSSTTGGFVNSYSYNANGEQTGRTLSSTAYTLGFDYDGQISSITQGTSTVSFGYDALGRRISRTAGGTTTDFQLLGQYFPLLENQGSTTTAAYTYGNELVRMNGESRHIAGIFDIPSMTAAAPSGR